jgi:choline dehydrogenase-like flavoprotein
VFQIKKSPVIYDVAIVGSGAAGGITAHVLTNAGLQVALLEAGPLRSPAEFPTHRIRRWNLPYRGLRGDYMQEWLQTTHFLADDKAEPYAWDGPDAFEWVRVRAVGGKSLFWAGVTPRFSRDEFQPLDDWDTRWPISYADIEPFYDRVEEMIGVTSTLEGAGAFPVNRGFGAQRPNCAEVELKKAAEALPGRGLKVLPIPKAILPIDYKGRPRCHHCGPCWQGCDSGSKFDSLRVFVKVAERTGKLTLLTGARVRSIALGKNGRAESLHYWDVKDRTYREVRAHNIVLAAGCIESTQILLNSQIANSSGLVGCYLSEHLYGEVGGFLPQLIGRPIVNEDSNGANVFIPDLTRNWRGKKFIRGYQLYLTGGIGETTLVGQNLPGFGQEWKKHVRQYYPAAVSVLMQGEVLPYRENRIEVDERLKDDAGIPGVRFFFKWGENESAMFHDFREVATELLQKAGAEMLADPAPRPFGHGASVHYVGTARMGTDRKSSVVDRWNRCHDVPNLSVHDAAVFVTAGNQNPTLTILALALRASEQLTKTLRASGPARAS